MKKSSLQPKIVFQDECLLVLDKPAGMVVNRASTVKEKTLQDWLIENGEWRMAKSREYRSGIVHRLDKETSGLILVAKMVPAMENLQSQFKARQVKKKYLALVHGKMTPSQGEIALPIGRRRQDRQKFGIVVDGKKARTKYKILRHYDMPASRDSFGMKILGEFSFLEIMPLTGRTHQIRVHLSFLGHPVVADLKYAGKRAKKDRVWCPRLFLHATYLGFHHPQTGQFCQFFSSLPQELGNAILRLCGKGSS